MYSVSQSVFVALLVVVAGILVVQQEFLANLLPSTSSSLTLVEQEQLLKSLVFLAHKHKTMPLAQPLGESAQAASSFRRTRIAFCCSADLDVSVRAVDLMERVYQLEQEHLAHKKKHTKHKSKESNHAKSTKSARDPTSKSSRSSSNPSASTGTARASTTTSHTKRGAALKKQHHERIGSLEQLQESFAFYFSSGAAAEQSMSSPEQFREVVKLANANPKVRHNVGGNAATMAERASVEGSDVLLGAAIGKEMKKHFNQDIQLVGHLEDRDQEDIHLVLEYSKGDSFRNYVSPRANRYYLNHDIHNARLSVLEEFEQRLDTFKPDIVVFGGLQLMEVETDESQRLARLQELSKVLQNLLVTNTPTHYEFAAASDFGLFDDTIRLVLPFVHSIGLNEQELHILHHYLTTGEEATATNSRPSVADVTKQISDVLELVNTKKAATSSATGSDAWMDPLSRLTRLHFHTLQFHIICQKTSSNWEDPTAALLQSALMSTKLACGAVKPNEIMRKSRNSQPSDTWEIDFERVEMALPRRLTIQTKTKKLPMEIDPFAPVLSWEDQQFQCYLVPMLACKKPDQTAGLGDNISGTGIAYHTMKPKPSSP